MALQKARQIATLEIIDEAIYLKIAEALIERPNTSDAELGDLLGVCRQTANRYRNSPEAKQAVCNLLMLSEKRVRRLLSKSLSRLETLMDDPDPKIQIAAIATITKISIPMMTKTAEAIQNDQFDFGGGTTSIHSNWFVDKS